MGISSQGEAFTMIDKNGKALCNALFSSDIRANELIAPFTEMFGEEKLYQITGHAPHFIQNYRQIIVFTFIQLF